MTGSQPQIRVSVIMASFNGAHHLPAAIESVRAQTLAEWELLIADDASTDGSAAIAARFAAQDPRIRLIQNEANMGPAASRNRALAEAKGAWLAIMDSDDIMHPARLKTLIAAAERDGAGIVADDLIVFYEDQSRRSHGFLPASLAGRAFWIDATRFVRSNTFYAGGAGLGYLKPIIRADLLAQASCRYDETLTIGEDYDFILRLLLAGLKYRAVPRQLYYYRKHGDSISHRLPGEAARAVLDAGRRALAALADAAPELVSAMRTRNRSLETVLEFNAVIEALKSRRLVAAVARILRRPGLIPLLREPFSAGLSRLLARLSSIAASRPAFGCARGHGATGAAASLRAPAGRIVKP
jgi:succinoglycan biosynthesis protein ExoO